MSILNLQKKFLKKRVSLGAIAELHNLQSYNQKNSFYKNIENMEEIFDTIPAKGDYTMFEMQVAETLAQEIFEQYQSLIFNHEIALSKYNVLFSKEVEYQGVFCAGVTWSNPAKQKVLSIELSMTMIRNNYRLRKNVLHEMCHAYRYFEGNQKLNHGKVWKENTESAIAKLETSAELEENLNVTSMPAKPKILNCYPPKFLYECENCHKFTEKAAMTKQCKKCGNKNIILVKLNENSNKVEYTRKGAQRKLFFRYEIWKRLNRTARPKEEFRNSEEVISRSREIVEALRNNWNSMNDEAKEVYDEYLHSFFVTNHNLEYFNELLS